MIYVIDKASVGQLHVMYNAAMLKVLLLIYPSEECSFFAEHTHLGFVSNALSAAEQKKIRFEPIPLLKSTATNPLRKVGQWLQKLQQDRRFFRSILQQAGHSHDSRIFLLTAATMSFLAYKRMKKAYTTPVVATLHGELEHVYFRQGARESIIGLFYKRIFRTQAPSFYYLLLNKIAKPTLISDAYLKTAEVLEIDHPYIFAAETAKAHQLQGPLVVGHVGSLGIRKGAERIYQLGAMLQPEIEQDKVSLLAIGPIEANVLGFKNQWVKDFATADDPSSYLSRSDFESAIAALDYALFFYRPTQFIYRASGAIFDVITYLKPIIVLRHPYFDYIFSQAGDIGYICDNVADMAQLVKTIMLQNDDQRYRLQVQNLKAYKAQLSIENIAEDLKAQLSVKALLV